MTRRETDRRARIMAVAAKHFMHDGFEGTSLDRIAADASVSKQAIYGTFRDKADLFEQVVLSDLGEPRQVGRPLYGDVRMALESIASQWFESYVSPRNLGLFRASIVAMRRFPRLASALHEHRRNRSRGLASYLEAKAAEGVIAVGSGNTLNLATRLGGMAVEGTRYLLGEELPSPRRRQAQVRLAVELFLHGVGGDVSSFVMAEPRKRSAQPEPMADRPQLRLKPERFDGLCRAAADEFLEQGFGGASLGQITAATGIGRATIYRQFGSKEGLFRHVVGLEIAEASREIAVPPAGSGLVPRLEQLCDEALRLHLRPRSIALHQLLVQESDTFPALARALYEAQVARVGAPLAQILESERLEAPPPPVVRAFHALATFSVRYLLTAGQVGTRERRAMSVEAATLFAGGVSRSR